MAVSKKKADLVEKEEMEEFKLEEQGDPEERLVTVPPSEISVEEGEAETEEVPESSPSPTGPDPGTAAIMEGFNMLRDELRSRGEAPPPVPVKEEGESDADFAKRVNEDIFKEDPYGILSKAIDRRARKIVESEVGPILGSIMESAFENAEFRLINDKKDGPVYEKFKGEISKIMKGLAPAQQRNPQVLKNVFSHVKGLHSDEIIEMEVERRLKENKPAATPAPKRPPVSEGGSTVLPEATGRTVRIPKSELDQLKTKAARMGVPVEVLVERRGKF